MQAFGPANFLILSNLDEEKEARQTFSRHSISLIIWIVPLNASSVLISMLKRNSGKLSSASLKSGIFPPSSNSIDLICASVKSPIFEFNPAILLRSWSWKMTT